MQPSVCFGDPDAGGIVVLRKFRDYYEGYTDADGKVHTGYAGMIAELTERFPLSEPRITGEQNQRDFIALFGAILRMRNLLVSFDEFKGREILSDLDFQNYLGRYQDLHDEWSQRDHGDKEDITDDIVFEIELVRQVEINIDYILMLVKKYHDSHCNDKEILISIRRAVDASPELRSKKRLIETFLAGINDVDDVLLEWNTFVAAEREAALRQIIQEENLREPETPQVSGKRLPRRRDQNHRHRHRQADAASLPALAAAPAPKRSKPSSKSCKDFSGSFMGLGAIAGRRKSKPPGRKKAANHTAPPPVAILLFSAI